MKTDRLRPRSKQRREPRRKRPYTVLLIGKTRMISPPFSTTRESSKTQSDACVYGKTSTRFFQGHRLLLCIHMLHVCVPVVEKNGIEIQSRGCDMLRFTWYLVYTVRGVGEGHHHRNSMNINPGTPLTGSYKLRWIVVS